MAPRIVFEDKFLLVLLKPAGMVVNRAQTVKQETLQDWLEKKRPALVKLDRSGIVHRLDKETSGLMVVAKTQAAFVNLQGQFKQRQVVKEYLTLVHGRLEPRLGEIVLPIARTKKDRKKFGVLVEGRKARTKYQVQRYCQNEVLGKLSLVKVRLLTGRTHQIRVHLSFLGHPIISDPKYGGKQAKKDRQFCPRMFLHAVSIGFYHPQTKRWRQFNSPLPFELKKAILNLCSKESA